METINEAARLMGRARTPAKAEAARRNGKKGGRPRRKTAPPVARQDLAPRCGCVIPAGAPKPFLLGVPLPKEIA
jgi:hypothetical protein